MAEFDAVQLICHPFSQYHAHRFELYLEKADNGSIVKQINFKFGVYYEWQKCMGCGCNNESTDEGEYRYVQ